MKQIYSVSVVWLSLVCLQVTLATDTLYSLLNDNRCFKNKSALLTTIRLVNERQCAIQCTLNPDCDMSVSNFENNTCELYSSVYQSRYQRLTYESPGSCQVAVNTWKSVNVTLDGYELVGDTTYQGTRILMYNSSTVTTQAAAIALCDSIGFDLAQLGNTSILNITDNMAIASGIPYYLVGAQYNATAAKYLWIVSGAMVTGAFDKHPPNVGVHRHLDESPLQFCSRSGSIYAFACTN